MQRDLLQRVRCSVASWRCRCLPRCRSLRPANGRVARRRRTGAGRHRACAVRSAGPAGRIARSGADRHVSRHTRRFIVIDERTRRRSGRYPGGTFACGNSSGADIAGAARAHDKGCTCGRNVLYLSWWQ